MSSYIDNELMKYIGTGKRQNKLSGCEIWNNSKITIENYPLNDKLS